MPRAPLPGTSVIHARVVSCTTSKGVTPSSSLLRAHAPNQLPPPEFVYPHLSPEVFAGCCEPLLETGSSRRYLYMSFPGCLSHGSRRVVGCLCLLLPLHRRPSPSPAYGSAFPESPRKETSCGGCFEIVAIPYVQASWFARHPGLPCRCALKRSQDSRDFYTRAHHAPLPMHASGMLAVESGN